MTIDRALHISTQLCLGLSVTMQNEERMEYNWLCYCMFFAKKEVKKNNPLTLDELREMDGEPVWLTGYGWRICCGVVNLDGGLKMPIGGGANIALDDRYGKTLFAYRRPPEKEAIQL